jgi:hypothetical protein
MYILVTNTKEVQCHATLSYSSREKDRIVTYTLLGLELHGCSCKIINT